MKVIIGGTYYPTIDGSSVSITRSVSDPVPTCTVNIVDNNSSLTPQEMQEILILDDQVTPNPTINMLLNPAMNPYNSHWGNTAVTGLAFSQNSGGGTICTVNNAAINTYDMASQTLITPIAAGQTYCFSAFIQGSSSPTNISTNLKIFWLDGTGNNFIGSPSLFTGPVPTGTGLVRYSLTATAPATAVYAQPLVELNVTNATNSGVITITEPQFEPVWFPTLSYPTPWCAPAQTNCQQLPNGLYIRQYRKFAGFVTFWTAQDYHGNVRTLVVQASGYAWLMATIIVNDTFTSKTDAQIITTLLGKYLLNNGVAMLNTTNVVTGQTLTSVQSNWDDLRTIFDNLASQSTFYWTIDAYWNMIYAPPGYFAMPISLICDDSSQPDMITTFPAYTFSADHDFTQPGSNILVLGNGSNVAQVTDPNVIAQIGITSGYILPTPNSWMRKVNESSLASVADCTNRGLAEMLQYDYPRNIYHLTTNVELIPGESIQITSATEGLSQATQLIQQTTATWIGTDETLTDVWEYASDLGAANKAATTILSRIFRIANSNTSAPAISATTLETLENIGIVDTVATSVTLAIGYQPTIQSDSPIAYYRLDEGQGTVADDYSGLSQQGTINGGVTLGVAGLLTDASDTGDTAMTFNGTTGYIALPNTGTWPTGNGAWSLEAWCKPTNSTNTNDAHLVTIGNPGTNSAQGVICQTSTGGWGIKTNGGAGHDFSGNGTSTAGTIYYIAGTYDGASNLNLYVVTSGVISHFGPFNPGTLALTTSAHQRIGSTNVGAGETFFFPGVIDEGAVYNSKLSATQIARHYAAGTSLYALIVMQDVPTAYYRLGEATGTTANDASGNANNGTYNGTFTLAQTGAIFNDSNTAVLFDGSTAYMGLPTATNGNGDSAITVEMWTKLSTSSLGSFTQLIQSGTSAAHTGYQIFWASNNTLEFAVGNGTTTATASYSVSAVSGAWWHIVGVYTGSQLQIYVNGVQQGTTPALSGTISASAVPIVASIIGHSSSFFPGDIDEVAIYPTALSAARIQTHYNVGTLGHQ